MDTARFKPLVSPKIYVASLSDYNAGRLHGVWIDLREYTSEDEVWDEIHAMLARSKEPPAEEWAIHDYEGFYGLRLSEWEPIARLVNLAAMLDEHGEAFAAWVDLVGMPDDESFDEDEFLEAFVGEYDSVKDWAGEQLEDVLDLLRGATSDTYSDVCDTLGRYLDAEAFAHDAEVGGEIWTHKTESHRTLIFRNI